MNSADYDSRQPCSPYINGQPTRARVGDVFEAARHVYPHQTPEWGVVRVIKITLGALVVTPVECDWPQLLISISSYEARRWCRPPGLLYQLANEAA